MKSSGFGLKKVPSITSVLCRVHLAQGLSSVQLVTEAAEVAELRDSRKLQWMDKIFHWF